MLEEQAIVLSVEAGAVWVEADRRKGCERCEAGEGCGGGVLGKLVVRRASKVRALNQIPGLVPGDEVVLGLDEKLLVRGSMMAYLMPLICMLGAAFFAELVLQPSDLAVAAFGALGLAAGLLLLRLYAFRMAQRGEMQPKVMRRAQGINVGCRVQPAN